MRQKDLHIVEESVSFVNRIHLTDLFILQEITFFFYGGIINTPHVGRRNLALPAESTLAEAEL